MPTKTTPRDELATHAARLAEQLSTLDGELSDVDERLSTAAGSAQLPDRALLAERRELLDSRELVGAEHDRATAEITRLDAIAAAEEAERERVAAEARAAAERAAAAEEAHRLADGWMAAMEAAEAAVRDAATSLLQLRHDLKRAITRANGEAGTAELEHRLHESHDRDLPRARVYMASHLRGAKATAEELVNSAFSGRASQQPNRQAEGLATIPQHVQEAEWRARNGVPDPNLVLQQEAAEQAAR